MGDTSRTVPIKASAKYVSAFKILAIERNMTMAAMVKEAVDAMYGDEIREQMARSEQRDTKKVQKRRKRTADDETESSLERQIA